MTRLLRRAVGTVVHWASDLLHLVAHGIIGDPDWRMRNGDVNWRQRNR